MEIRDYEYVLVPNILAGYKCSSSGECCKSKWRIDIDSISYEKTKEELNNIGEDIEEYIGQSDKGDYVTKFANGYCKFITNEKLCRIHRDFGWECLSDTCKVYPRILKLTSRGLEMGLVFSCRSSAKLLLKEEDFEIIKVKKEDLFIMKPGNVAFIIPENNIPSSAEYRYFEMENFMMDILKKEDNLGKKVQFLYEKINEFFSSPEIENYDFSKTLEDYPKYKFQKYISKDLNDYIIKTILIKEGRSKAVSNEFINLLKLVRLSGDLEKDKDYLREDSFLLTLEDIEEMKKSWTERDEKVLKNYLLCFIFNKEFYKSNRYAMMKMAMLGGMLKFRILLNKKYLKRDLTDEELIYTIKSHDNDFSHDGEYFNEFYNQKKEAMDIEDYIRKMITILY